MKTNIQKLREARIEAGISVADAAALIGVSRGGWNKWEAGTTTPNPIMIAAAMEAIERERIRRTGTGFTKKGRPPGPKKPKEPSDAFLEALSKTSVAAMQDPRFETVSSVADDMSHD